MKNLKKNHYFLHMLAKAPPAQKRALLRTATNPQISALCEICLNILAGHLPLNIKRLKKYKNTIRKLSKRSISVRKKKALLVNQSGGFLPALAPVILSALAGLVGRVIGDKIAKK